MSVDTTPDIASDLNLGPMVTDLATTGNIIRHTDDRWNLLLALDHFKNWVSSYVILIYSFTSGVYFGFTVPYLREILVYKTVVSR